MELQQMRYAVAIDEERSFTRAAERCHVVQSALSHQVKALERELGVVLFARTNRRVEPTAAGEAFLRDARACLAAAERAVRSAGSGGGELRGTLTIGVIPTVTAIDVPSILASFHENHPGVRIRLRDGGSDEFIAAISEGVMDVAVLGLPDGEPPRGVASRALVRERLAAVVSIRHRLARRRRLVLRELAAGAFVDFPEGSPGRAQSDLAFRAAGLRREVEFEAMNRDLMLDLVRHDLGVAILSPAVVPDDAGIRAIPIADGPVRVEYLAWSDFNPAPAARAFLEELGDLPPQDPSREAVSLRDSA